LRRDLAARLVTAVWTEYHVRPVPSADLDLVWRQLLPVAMLSLALFLTAWTFPPSDRSSLGGARCYRHIG
jgi:hypothetical protein